MKTGLITPVTNIDADIMDCKRHLECEFGEFCEAWNNYHADETNKKNMAHLLEEIIDLATACMTLADRIEKEAQIPDLVNNTLLMVGAKNYTRGYHDTPMI